MKPFIYTSGFTISVGDKVKFGESGNYTNGGGYARYGEGIVVSFGSPSPYITIACSSGRDSSSSVNGSMDEDLSGNEISLWFQGPYNPDGRTYQGMIELA